MTKSTPQKSTLDVSRRNFVIGAAAAGAGLSFGFSVPATAGEAKARMPEVNAWVVINPDDSVTIRIARSEMGQGSLTGLAQLVAEELECDWSKVTTEFPTPGENLARDRVWGSFATGGSRGIRTSHQYIREGGAAARHMLIAAAAKTWGVPATECSAANSVITHGASGRTTTYGKVATQAASLSAPSEITLKDPKDWKIAGQPVKRLDTEEKLNGALVYGADFTLPDMLNAAIKACPVFGGTLKSYDESAVLNMPGVKKVVRVDDTAVAVVADTWWRAKTALDALPITWDEGPHAEVTSASVSAWLDEGLDAEEAFVGNKVGDAKAGLAKAARVVEGTYSFPWQSHATMEPMNATAKWTADKCEVWCPTQNGESALQYTAQAAGLPVEKCEVYKLRLGGGFGRRGMPDYIIQAVSIAKQMPGTPVKLLWTREEDMTHDFYHPTTKAKFTAGLDEDGELVALHGRISGQSITAALRPQGLRNGADLGVFQGLLPEGDHGIVYTIPDLLMDHSMRNPHVPPGYWRGVNINQNAYYMESFLDEVAHASGQDALELRRKLMKDHPKMLAVLETAAKNGGWGKEDGKHRGLSACRTFGSYVAACAEVSVNDQGEIRIDRITAATDPGHAVNPQQIEAQVQGSFVYGLSAMLFGEITIDGGRVVEQNFDTYPSLKIKDMPDVDVTVMPSGGFWGGVGEPTIAVAAPAVANAIFNATGRRVRDLPLSKMKQDQA